MQGPPGGVVSVRMGEEREAFKLLHIHLGYYLAHKNVTRSMR
jgi:hypothetical protein